MGIPKSILDPSHDTIGVHYLEATPSTPPLRIYYPAATDENQNPRKENQRPIGWFEESGVQRYLEGYAHVVGVAPRDTPVFQSIFRNFLCVASFFLPMTWMRIPGVYENATPVSAVDMAEHKKKLPLIVFSHGLTGTGQENAVLCAAWAKKGYVVASVHHTDGSSCQVRLADGTDKFYEGIPDYSNYDPTFRPRQIQSRAKEFVQAYDFLTGKMTTKSDPALPDGLRELIDPNMAVAAGYSYGAATVARAVAMENSPFKAAIFLDGWFHIHFPNRSGKEIFFSFPQEAFDLVRNRGDGTKGLPIPSLFMMSEQFQGLKPFFDATKELAGDDTTVHVLPGTGHQNFCDVVFWLKPMSVVKALSQGLIGSADTVDVYHEIIQRSGDFLDTVTKTCPQTAH